MTSKFIGPIQFDAKVTLKVGNRIATITVGMTPGRAIIEEDIHAAIGNALIGAREQLGDAEILNAKDFFNTVLVQELTGRKGKFALPSEYDYNVAELEAASLAASKATEADRPKRKRRSRSDEEE